MLAGGSVILIEMTSPIIVHKTENEDHLIIEARIPSKKNNYRSGKDGKHYIENQVKADIDGITRELQGQRNRARITKPHAGSICVRIFYCLPIASIKRSRRQDRDNMTTTIFDCLQASKVIENDYMIDEHHVKTVYWDIDKFITHILISSTPFQYE